MDIVKFKSTWASLMGQMLVIDPVTGLPTTQNIKVYAQAPFSLPETDLPIWVLFTGAATYPDPPIQGTNTLARENRQFTARLYVCVAETGTDGEAERRVQPYIDTARDHIQRHIQLWDDNPANAVPGIKRTWLVKDTGPQSMMFEQSPTKYLGIVYTVKADADNEVVYDPRQ